MRMDYYRVRFVGHILALYAILSLPATWYALKWIMALSANGEAIPRHAWLAGTAPPAVAVVAGLVVAIMGVLAISWRTVFEGVFAISVGAALLLHSVFTMGAMRIG